jgi:hypothetical protein
MIQQAISVLIFASDSLSASAIKVQVEQTSPSVLFLTAYSLPEFKKKAKWLATTFIIVQKEMMTRTVSGFIGKNELRAPVIIGTLQQDELLELPFRLKLIYDDTAGCRSKEALARKQKITQQKQVEALPKQRKGAPVREFKKTLGTFLHVLIVPVVPVGIA